MEAVRVSHSTSSKGRVPGRVKCRFTLRPRRTAGSLAEVEFFAATERISLSAIVASGGKPEAFYSNRCGVVSDPLYRVRWACPVNTTVVPLRDPARSAPTDSRVFVRE